MNEYTIRLAGGDSEFRCAADDTLLRAALRAGIGLPYECNSGGCGACRYQVVEGSANEVWPQAPGIPQQQRDRGFRLACQSRPGSDCTIRVRGRLRHDTTPRPQRRLARLSERIDLTADMAEFVFRTEDAAKFEAGQFALLSLPGVQGDRAYSMSNLPNEEGLWRFVVKRMVNGKGSNTLFSLPLGSEVTLDGPYGLAYLRHDSPRDIICIAGGSGLSPVLAILAGAAQSPQQPQRGLQLFYGGRRPCDVCVPDVIERDPSLRGRVACVTAVSDPLNTDAWDGERGFIHEVVQRRLAAAGNPADYDYYFCGPPSMTDAVQRLLLDLRVPTSQAFYDRFV